MLMRLFTLRISAACLSVRPAGTVHESGNEQMIMQCVVAHLHANTLHAVHKFATRQTNVMQYYKD